MYQYLSYAKAGNKCFQLIISYQESEGRVTVRTAFALPLGWIFLRALSQSLPNFSRIEVLRNVTTREGHRENRRIRRCSHQPAYRLSYILQQVMFAFPHLQSAFADFGLGLHKAGTRESRLFKKHCKKLEYSLLSNGFSL